MKQEELSESIREGLNKSRSDLASDILKALMIIVLIIGVIVAIGKYQEYKFEKENCGGEPCTVGIAGVANECDKPYLSCMVIDKDMEIAQRENKSSGGGVRAIIYYQDGLCGYEEANAWLEQYKKQIDKENIYLECD